MSKDDGNKNGHIRKLQIASTAEQRQRGMCSLRIDIEVPLLHATTLEEILQKRGASLQDWLQVQLARSANLPVMLNLETGMQFGKYRGVALEKVIRVEPEYIQWLLDNVEKFEMSSEAHTLLDEISEEKIKRRAQLRQANANDRESL